MYTTHRKNPFLSITRLEKERIFAQEGSYMTAQATYRQLLYGFIFMVLAGTVVWRYYAPMLVVGSDQNVIGQTFSGLSNLLLGSGFIAFLLGAATMYKPTLAPYTLFPYASLQGLSLGTMTLLCEMAFPGIALQASLGTAVVGFVVLFVHMNRLFVMDARWRRRLYTVLSVVMVMIVLNVVFLMVGIRAPFRSLYGYGPVGIGFSMFMIVLASFALLDDVQRVSELDGHKLPDYMNGYLAMGLMMTLIWLYVEIVRLLIKLKMRQRNRRV